MWRIGVCVFALLFLDCSADNLIVETPNGKVQGTNFTSVDGEVFYTWRHIPFAKPPVGQRRFLAPEPADAWTDVLDGTKDAKACFFVGSFVGDPVPLYGYSEDCLYINVYSPVPPNPSARRSVMVYIYGGGFYVGSADFAFCDPTPLLENDVIVVTFNYRLDVFGFLSTEDAVLPGNSALKDQLLALKWTKENIAYFGGNPSDITIFGESAGAMSVGYHLISEQSRNLFTGAIMESGSALTDDIQTNGKLNAVTLANQFNSSITLSSTSEDILEVLQAVDAVLLVNVSYAVQTSNSSDDQRLFKPIIEPKHSSAFLSKPLYEQLEVGDFLHVPIIIGINSEEALADFTNDSVLEEVALTYDSNYTLLLPNVNLKDDADIDLAVLEIKTAYAGIESFQEDPGSIVKFLSDTVISRSVMKHAILQAQYSPVYFYKFSFVGTRSENHIVIPGCGRVSHSEELPYVFNISAKPIETSADYLTRRRMVKMWTNFAKTKNPTPSNASDFSLEHVQWEQFDAENLRYLDIGDNLELKYYLKDKEITFWEYFWERYVSRPYNTF